MTNEKIGSSRISKITGLPLSKVRRNVKEFLPPDPVATRRSGYSRSFSTNDAFMVFLGTHLVSVLGYSFYDAKQIIQELWPWAESVALLPQGNTCRTGIDKNISSYEVRIIYDNIHGGYYYQVLGYLNKSTKSFDDDIRGRCAEVTSRVYSYDIAPRGNRAFNLVGSELLSAKILRFQTLVTIFMVTLDDGKTEKLSVQRWSKARENE